MVDTDWASVGSGILTTWGMQALLAFLAFLVLCLMGWILYAWMSYPKKFPFIKWYPWMVWLPFSNALIPRIYHYALAKQGAGGIEDVGRVKEEPDARIPPLLTAQIMATAHLGGMPAGYRPHKGEFFPMEMLTVSNSKQALEALIERDNLISEQRMLIQEFEQATTTEERKVEIRARVAEINEAAKPLERILAEQGRPVLKPIVSPAGKQFVINTMKDSARRFMADQMRLAQLLSFGAVVLVMVALIFSNWILAGTNKTTAELNLQAQRATIEQVRNISGLCQDYAAGYAKMVQSYPLAPIPTTNPGG